MYKSDPSLGSTVYLALLLEWLIPSFSHWADFPLSSQSPVNWKKNYHLTLYHIIYCLLRSIIQKNLHQSLASLLWVRCLKEGSKNRAEKGHTQGCGIWFYLSLTLPDPWGTLQHKLHNIGESPWGKGVAFRTSRSVIYYVTSWVAWMLSTEANSLEKEG